MEKRISLQHLLVLNAPWVGLSFMWNALHPIILPALLLNFVPDARKNSYLGILTFLGLLIACVTQPLSGALSDGWVSTYSRKYGRRRPWIALGTLLAVLFLGVLAWGGGLAWLLIGYLGLQFSANTAQGPLQGLLRDDIPADQIGVASSTKIALDVFSLILASLLAGRLMDSHDGNPAAIMIVIVVVLSTSVATTLFLAREAPGPAANRFPSGNLAAQFRLDFHRHTAYWWLIAERALFLLGIYGVQAFAQYYLQDVLRVPNPPRQTGDLLAAIAAGLLILVLIGGRLTDKLGAKKVLYVATGVTVWGMILLLATTEARGLPLFGSILGAGIGLFLTSNWALANQLAPQDQAGKFLGLTNLATAGSAALARLQGPAIDFLNAARPAEWIGYKALFAFGIACILLSTVFLTRIHGTRDL